MEENVRWEDKRPVEMDRDRVSRPGLGHDHVRAL